MSKLSSDNVQIATVPTERVLSDVNRIRTFVGPVDGLKSTIADAGLLQPILVRKSDHDTFTVIDGERRLRALKELGVTELIVGRDLLLDVDETEADIRFKQIISNVQHEELNPLELGKAFVILKESYGYKYNEIAEIIGKSSHFVNAKVGLARRLEPAIQERYVLDLEREKGIQNTFSGDEHENLYVVNLNVLEDIARLPGVHQVEAYETITSARMGKEDALEYLRELKITCEAENSLQTEAITFDNSIVCKGEYSQKSGDKTARKKIQKLGRELEKLTSAFSSGEYAPDSDIIIEIEEMMEQLNLLYASIKSLNTTSGKAESIV